MKNGFPLTRANDAAGEAPGPGPGEIVSETSEARLLALLESYGSLLRRTISYVCRATPGVSVEDIEQEARVRLWKALQRERNIAYPRSYLYKVAVSAAIRAIRDVTARREEGLDDQETMDRGTAPYLRANPETSPERLAEREEWRRRLEAATDCLSENRRLAVRLHLQGFTTLEIGTLLGWSEPKARNLVHRGLNDVRKRLLSRIGGSGIPGPEDD